MINKKMDKSSVYKITFKKFSYIGETNKNIEERIYEHFFAIDLIDSKILQLFIDTQSWNNFDVKVLETNVSPQKVKNAEDNCIIKYNTLYPNGFNIHTSNKNSDYKAWYIIDRRYNLRKYKDNPSNLNLFYENILYFYNNNTSKTKRKKFVLNEIILPYYLIDIIGKYNHLENFINIDYYFKYYNPKTIMELPLHNTINKKIKIPLDKIKITPFFQYFTNIDILSETNLQKTLIGKHITYHNKIIINYNEGVRSFNKVTSKTPSLKQHFNKAFDELTFSNNEIMKKTIYEIRFRRFIEKYNVNKISTNVKDPKYAFSNDLKLNIGYYKVDEYNLLFIRYQYIPLIASELLDVFKKRYIDDKIEIYIVDESTIAIKFIKATFFTFNNIQEMIIDALLNADINEWKERFGTYISKTNDTKRRSI